MFLLLQPIQNQPPSLLSFAVVAAIVSTCGAFLAMVVKDYFFARSLEKWRTKQSLASIYRKYKDPIVLAAIELTTIMHQICKEYPPHFVRREVVNLKPKPSISNALRDEYFLKYKLVSSVYRLCSFLGWLELYRQDVVFLDSGHDRINSRLGECLKTLRKDLSDGELNKSEDIAEWVDVLIYREEQRAIGETMISSNEKTKAVIGYRRFCSLFDGAEDKEESHWIRVAMNFFLSDDDNPKDFRLIRMQRMIVHLVDLIEVLDSSRLSDTLNKRRNKYKSQLTKPGVSEF